MLLADITDYPTREQRKRYAVCYIMDRLALLGDCGYQNLAVCIFGQLHNLIMGQGMLTAPWQLTGALTLRYGC